MRYSWIHTCATLVFLVGACGDAGGGGSTSSTGASTGSDSTTGSSADTAGSTSATSVATDGSTGGSSGESAADTGSGSATDTGSSSAADTGTDTGGSSCGKEVCNENEYCDWITNSCGTGEIDEGHCMPRPDDCPEIYEPVCGCDGTVHGNVCDAQSQGLDVDALAGCEAPKGTFECGFMFCDPASAYCIFSPTDALPSPDSYTCALLPRQCGDNPDCGCLEQVPCAEFGCEATPDGGLQITCPGG